MGIEGRLKNLLGLMETIQIRNTFGRGESTQGWGSAVVGKSMAAAPWVVSGQSWTILREPGLTGRGCQAEAAGWRPPGGCPQNSPGSCSWGMNSWQSHLALTQKPLGSCSWKSTACCTLPGTGRVTCALLWESPMKVQQNLGK